MGEGMTLKEHGLRGQALKDLLVLDVHGHLGNEIRVDIPARSAEQVVAIMDRVGIDILCVSHLLSLTGGYRRGHDLLAEAMQKFPGRLFGYAAVNPNYPDDVERELDRCIGQLGMRGIKTHVSMHAYPAEGPGLWRAYDYAQQHGPLPVLVHSFGDVGAAERIAQAFPDVPFILAHCGGAYHGRFDDELVMLAARCDNVYLDLAEERAQRKTPMTMEDWQAQVNAYIQAYLNLLELLARFYEHENMGARI